MLNIPTGVIRAEHKVTKTTSGRADVAIFPLVYPVLICMQEVLFRQLA